MSDFQEFSKTMNAHWEKISSGKLFRVKANGDELWEAYLAAFPEGTNPIYIERTTHDCSCCKQFIRNIAAVVAIKDGIRTSVWDIEGLNEPYATVAQRMAELVASKPILTAFFAGENKFGVESNVQLLEGNETKRWHHFHCDVPSKNFSLQCGKVEGDASTNYAMLKRALTELKSDALETVEDLIGDGAIYRGEEHLRAIQNFKKLMEGYSSAGDKELFLWENFNHPSARFRNTVIGSLIDEISSGKDLEGAVKSFEAKVAPSNYKRPKSLITKAMVEKAMEKIDSLGYRTSLERRHAKLEDININDVLFVDNETQTHMKGGIEGLLMEEVKEGSKLSKDPTKISIVDFMEKIVPISSRIDMFVENAHKGNFMSLTAPVNPDAKNIFQWDNNFAWAYNGEVADSDIKERVKRAGGNVDAALRVSLAWHNGDDLDLHCNGPMGHIFYGAENGVLDVDMNAGGAQNRVDPVENMQFRKLPNGEYKFSVNQFSKRQYENVGFTVEIEANGVVEQFHHEMDLGRGETDQVLKVQVENGIPVKVLANSKVVTVGAASGEFWGIETQNLVRVRTITSSPNHWGENEKGNRHWFFFLEGCANPDPVRGIFNEFLSPELAEHRKVFEVLGSKMKCDPTETQMSGLGFSSTKRNSAKVLATTKKGPQSFEIQF